MLDVFVPSLTAKFIANALCIFTAEYEPLSSQFQERRSCLLYPQSRPQPL